MAASFVDHFAGDLVALNASTATLIHTSGPSAGNNGPEQIIVMNRSAAVITVGGYDVTDEVNGLILPDGSTTPTSTVIPLRFPGIKVYAIASAGTPNVTVVRS